MDPSTTLRPLLPTDLPVVATWLRDYIAEHRGWWTEAYGAEPGTPLEDVVTAERDDLIGYSERDGHLVRVYATVDEANAANGGTPLGIVYTRIRQDRYMGLRIGVLGWIYVAPASRGRGVAGELMHAADAWFVARGTAGREVFVTAANARAVGLYQRHGYRIVDHRMLRGG